MGASDPQIFQAASSNETLEVTLEFTKTNRTGEEYVYQTLKLLNATVASARQYTAHLGDTSAAVKNSSETQNLEEVCFSFQKVEMSTADGKTTYATIGAQRTEKDLTHQRAIHRYLMAHSTRARHLPFCPQFQLPDVRNGRVEGWTCTSRAEWVGCRGESARQQQGCWVLRWERLPAAPSRSRLATADPEAAAGARVGVAEVPEVSVIMGVAAGAAPAMRVQAVGSR